MGRELVLTEDYYTLNQVPNSRLSSDVINTCTLEQQQLLAIGYNSENVQHSCLHLMDIHLCESEHRWVATI